MTDPSVRTQLLQDFGLVVYTLLMVCILYLVLRVRAQQRVITRLQDQIDLLVDLNDRGADPNEDGAIRQKLAQLRQANAQELKTSKTTKTIDGSFQ